MWFAGDTHAGKGLLMKEICGFKLRHVNLIRCHCHFHLFSTLNPTCKDVIETVIRDV